MDRGYSEIIFDYCVIFQAYVFSIFHQDITMFSFFCSLYVWRARLLGVQCRARLTEDHNTHNSLLNPHTFSPFRNSIEYSSTVNGYAFSPLKPSAKTKVVLSKGGLRPDELSQSFSTGSVPCAVHRASRTHHQLPSKSDLKKDWHLGRVSLRGVFSLSEKSVVILNNVLDVHTVNHIEFGL